jgi:hypothetical protein
MRVARGLVGPNRNASVVVQAAIISDFGIAPSEIRIR